MDTVRTTELVHHAASRSYRPVKHPKEAAVPKAPTQAGTIAIYTRAGQRLGRYTPLDRLVQE